MNRAQFKVDAVLVCDFIRREDSGKLIVIGLYPADVTVAQFPVSLSLIFFVAGEVLKPGLGEFTSTIEDEEGNVYFRSPPAKPQEVPAGRFVFAHQALLTFHKETKFRLMSDLLGTQDVLLTSAIKRAIDAPLAS